MKERIISVCLLLLAGLTVWLIAAELPKKEYARPASEFTEAVRSGTYASTQPVTPAAATGSTSGSPSVADAVIRLHILADSDDPRAQEIKLALRDILLPYLNTATLGAGTKEEALVQLTSQCPSLTEIANAFLSGQNTGYSATVSVERIYFPIRIYGSQTYLSKDAVIFPPGFYDSIQVVLGKGEGHNWWCLAYPSLCFIDASYDYIPKDSDLYRLKLGTVSESTLAELFYGEEQNSLLLTDDNDIKSSDSLPEDIDIYVGSKLWELLRNLLKPTP